MKKHCYALVMLFLLSGCALVGGGMDKVSEAFVEQVTDYCAQPPYRRQALWILSNGALEPHGIEVHVICPGDETE